MNKRVIYIAVSIALILSCALFFSRSPIKLPEEVATEYASLEEDIDFNRDVKKILSVLMSEFID